MSMPGEQTLIAFIDGALDADESHHIEQLLKSSADCRAQVESLIAERNLLRAALQTSTADGAIPAFVPRPTISRQLVWLGWAAITIWAVSTVWAGLVSSLTLPSWLAWLSPSAIGTSVQILTSTLLPGGSLAALTDSLISAAQSLVFALCALAGFGWLVRHQPGKAASSLIAVTAFSLLTVAPESHAFDIRRDEQRIVIAAGEVIDDTLIATAEDIVIEGRVTGDLIVAGESLRIRGTVDGLVVAMGESVQLEGTFGSSVISGGEALTLRGASIAGNFYGAGEELMIHDDVEISGNSATAGEEVTVHGRIGKDLITAAGRVTLYGSVGSNMRGYGSEVELTSTAQIGGNLLLKTESEESAIIAEGATIAGTTDISSWPEQPSEYSTADFYLGKVLQILAAFVTGLILFRLVPSLGDAELGGGSEALITAAVGSLMLIATPVLAFVAIITLIGAPLGLITLVLWLITLYAAGIVIACYIGRMILPNQEGTTLPLLLGLALLVVVTNIPIIGGPIWLVAGLLGLGLIGQWLRTLWETRAA